MKKLIDNLDYMITVYVPKNIFRVRLFDCSCCHNQLERDIKNGVKYIICRVCDDFKKCSQCNNSISMHNINNSCSKKICYKCLLPTCDWCGGKIECINCIVDNIAVCSLPTCDWCGGKIDCKNCIDAPTKKSPRPG